VTVAPALLELDDLSVAYPIRAGLLRRLTGHVTAVDHVSLAVQAGETLGLVGESGCGKSTLGRTVIGLTRATGGRIRFDGNDLATLSRAAQRQRRRQMQMVFQDPVGSLNPRFRIRDIVLEGRRIQGIRDTRTEHEVVDDMLGKVGLDPNMADRFPHELSGGQRQRVGIARTLVLGPRLIVADEPISALDVSVQSQVLNLLVDLQRELGLAYLFIAHNLAAVAYLADRIAVMYLGRIVELGPSEAVTSRPLHPTPWLCCPRSPTPSVAIAATACSFRARYQAHSPHPAAADSGPAARAPGRSAPAMCRRWICARRRTARPAISPASCQRPWQAAGHPTPTRTGACHDSRLSPLSQPVSGRDARADGAGAERGG
jgi:ABC-type oligopeptide transport system ATPase subunit